MPLTEWNIPTHFRQRHKSYSFTPDTYYFLIMRQHRKQKSTEIFSVLSLFYFELGCIFLKILTLLNSIIVIIIIQVTQSSHHTLSLNMHHDFLPNMCKKEREGIFCSRERLQVFLKTYTQYSTSRCVAQCTSQSRCFSVYSRLTAAAAAR